MEESPLPEEPLVLVVDDDDALRALAAQALAHQGFRVLEAANGQQAIDIFREKNPDLALLDVVMPGLSGFETCARMRQTPHGGHTPILIMTTRDDLDSIHQAYQVGATDFAVKPINYLVLAHRIRYMLRAKETADSLREHQSRLAHAQRIAKLGYWHWNLKTHQLYWSEAMCEMIGLGPDDPPPESFEAFLDQVHPADRERLKKTVFDSLRSLQGFRIEHRLIMPNGKERDVYQEAEFDHDEQGAPVRLVGAIQDITERRRAEKKIKNLAYYDGVTGLPNRALFKQHLAQAIAHAERHGRCVGLLSLDLDHFKKINESLGHGAGDDLLRNVSVRLMGCLRRSDCVSRRDLPPSEEMGFSKRRDRLARVGGDEFMILLTEVNRPEDAALVARRIGDAFKEPFNIQTREVYITASIGISTYPDDGSSAETLLRCANTAANHAKQQSRGQYQFFTATLNTRAMQQLALEVNLRKAIEKQEFELHYQPKIDVLSGAVNGVEALLRWRRPQGLLLPAEFIGLAEESGLIIPIGEWAIGEACCQVTQWRESGFPAMQMAVNLSAAQFRQDNLTDMIDRILEKTGIAPELLELELTESLIMHDSEASAALMKRLKNRGLRIAIDDFGTGYSSLSYLKRLPIDTLKIDKSFVDGLGQDEGDAAIVAATIELAHKLKLRVVAEGVERPEQLEFLRNHGCEEVQGFYFSQPQAPQALAQWLVDRDS